ncbi:8-amino-7-oxononanoate synthase [Pectobacterium atrosepticum SCRI1043]|uniref:8-amino-7-oxononanoate synthase n=1 Tax=Pectobacterium atrosepticum (strain SCRI 1043 / ATCC BAA-672) TaxID=218491 RepID=BIOF_PECAS|nr:8-amino-7-oxononanoate synthase [Pectobacterium atrosepticum]Q6D3C0.1 RecName: Full=8-amino-7-oxononanoate synthase; Short=AONS; AltName: Full=7-keto-8-amino-pelargonic acid synthase; Short=7-KAP synthase; Short=KAPA synthase; AltName: Full=8-amino-7-ketopelargonate synthase [Pectobacterium atrosepticum SCRI1043]GKV84889.1 8-amino-7-oxononanoate synthase [Pectobacterium carotovorum subsp. carotovorum]AIA71641.1 8-amino-7-oxononanoate synthase [Pectobacterium atrosepticum]AIK13556.1 8-amino-7
MSWQQRIEAALVQRQHDDAYRVRQSNQGGSGRWLIQGDRCYLNFSSNDYLGLSHHPEIVRAWQQGAEQYGIGSGGSGHVTGYTDAHASLENQLADWLGYPRALLFISGYAANQAVVAALAQAEDRIFADKLSHASLLEAAAQSPATLRRFKHNQADSLQALLEKPTDGQTLVVTEGVFSMDGDTAPLPALQAQCRAHDAWLMVDDAHGIGVLGDEGRGSCWQQDIKPELLIVTFGKAFGVSGAAVLCTEPLAEYFLQFARHLIYSTSMPAAQACALSAAVNCVRQGGARRDALRRNIALFRAGFSNSSYQLMNSQSAIQPLIVGENARALALMNHLREQGVWVSAMRPPTVPPGSARLRITLTAEHQPEDINRLLTVLHHADRKL